MAVQCIATQSSSEPNLSHPPTLFLDFWKYIYIFITNIIIYNIMIIIKSVTVIVIILWAVTFFPKKSRNGEITYGLPTAISLEAEHLWSHRCAKNKKKKNKTLYVGSLHAILTIILYIYIFFPGRRQFKLLGHYIDVHEE